MEYRAVLNTRRSDRLGDLFAEGNPSLEAIDFQYGNVFHNELVAEVAKLRETKKPGKTRLKKIIKEHLGLNTDIKMMPKVTNACTTFARLNQNHIFITDMQRFLGIGQDQGLRLLGKNKGKALRGEVDLKNSKVSGVFSEIKNTIHIGEGLFKGTRYSDEEIAAIVCHELGHQFTYCEMSTRQTTTNLIIQSSIDRFMGTEDRNIRAEIIKQVEEAGNVKIKDKEVVNARSPEVYASVVVKAMADKSRSEVGVGAYDANSFEAMSDQFATRHGFGVPLATGLDKINKDFGAYGIQNQTILMMMDVIKISIQAVNVVGAGAAVLFLGLKPLDAVMKTLNWMGPAIALARLMIFSPYKETYDRPVARADRIRQQLVEQLKDRNLPSEYRDNILEGIAIIDAAYEGKKDLLNLHIALWKYIHPIGTKQARSEDLQKDIEKLIGNNLFTAAAQLQSTEG